MKFPLFDAHCDTLFALGDTGQAIERNNLHVDLNRAERYAPYAQFFAIFGFHGRSCFDAEYKLFQEAIRANPDRMIHCRTAEQARAAARRGKIAAFLSIEGAELIACSLDQLREAHGLGVRMLTLTWNNPNGLSGTNAQEPERGLSDLGRQFVRTCEELGVIVDVAHLSESGFWDVAEMATRPFVVSHSNAKNICPHSRNLTDEQFRALIQSGGVAGINLYTDFLGKNADIDTVIAHIGHFLSLGGEKSIALGTDLDGCDKLPRGIHGIEDMEKIGERMLQKNYPESLIYDIFYHNLMRVVDDVCGI